MTAAAQTAAGLPTADRGVDLQTVQIGQEWITEKSGGLNRFFSELVQALPSVGVGVTGLVTGTAQVALRSSGAVRPFASLDDGLLARLKGVRSEVRKELAAHPGSLLVSHFALNVAPCLDLVRAPSLVVHFHGPWAEESRIEGQNRLAVSVKHWIERAVYRKATRVIVLSRAFRDLIVAHYRVDPERVRVIPGGVDTRRFAPAQSREQARRLLDWPRDRPIVLAVRRLVRRMGLEDLVDAVRVARESVPDLLVLVAGSGPIEAELKARAAGLGDHVRFLGFVPDEHLPLAYRAADLSIVPSVALEGFGLIVVESLAAGTPVLVTGVGGLPETLEGLAPQCIVTVPGPGPLATAMVDALRGHTPLPSPEACACHARQRFDWSVIAGRVRDTYKEALP
jgi:glycogen(starch) synthase